MDLVVQEDTSSVQEITENQIAKRSLVYTLIVDGVIGAVTDERISSAIEEAEENNAELLVIYLDTPGGFTNSTWEINKSILNSEVPVCMYIAPTGSTAGSAGVYMTYAAHFAAMASSTNIGAAHPVGGGGKDIDSLMNEKVTNDAVAKIKALAEKRGRNAEWAEKSVRESVSITSTEALELNVVNFVTDDFDSLMAFIHGKETETPSGAKTMNLENVDITDIKITTIQKILKIITNPEIALMLFSLGSLGLMLELYNPGSLFPGFVGIICLILSLYAFNVLPINYGGLALIVLGIILFVLEIKIVSHGFLTLGGLVSFILGGMMLVDTVDPTLQISKMFLFTIAAIVALVLIFLGRMALKNFKRKPFSTRNELEGHRATVKKEGFVYINGALWKIKSEDTLKIGDEIEILSLDNLTLNVKKIID